MLTIDHVLDQAMQLPYEDRQTVVEILRKRLIEEERDQITLAANEAQASYASGKVIRGSAEELRTYLEAEDE